MLTISELVGLIQETTLMAETPTRENTPLDHVVVVLFENRSIDNVLGRLYGPADHKIFEGVVGKEPEQSDPRVGRARSGPRGGPVRRRH